MGDRVNAPLNQCDRRYLRLLRMAPFARRGGGWRFGTNRIDADVVDRLVAAGRVVVCGDQVMLPRKAVP